ncbi:hypothetical protein D910_08749, partial [Dendroctonus ponderosae]
MEMPISSRLVTFLAILCAFQEAMIPGTPPINHITRGCQALRFGATCEDIFQQLRRRNEILPGQHTCTTCSTDLCNSNSRIMP